MKNLINTFTFLLTFISFNLVAQNVNLGTGAGNSGTDNTSIGAQAGDLVTGTDNAFVGKSAGGVTTLGHGNVFIGKLSGQSNTTGSSNTFIGRTAGSKSRTGNSNSFFGQSAGINLSSGSDNTFLGNGAGGLITSGTGNICIGSSAGPSLGSYSNLLYIDNTTTATPLIYGDFSTNQVGINTLPGSYTFNVGGSINATGIYVNGVSVSSADSWTVSGNNVYSSGNRGVGIGTTLTNNPNGYKLAVKGKLGAQEIQIENTSMTWSDFVFDEDYQLMSLENLEKFIKENKHLPEIPTTEEVRENGIILTELNAKLLQKIEELTLYVIELKKEVDELKTSK